MWKAKTDSFNRNGLLEIHCIVKIYSNVEANELHLSSGANFLSLWTLLFTRNILLLINFIIIISMFQMKKATTSSSTTYQICIMQYTFAYISFSFFSVLCYITEMLYLTFWNFICFHFSLSAYYLILCCILYSSTMILHENI